MKILSIETSTRNLSLAVSDGDRVLGYRNMTLDKILSSTIIPNIKKILDKTGVPLQQLDGFAVGLGPGSFTSLRVGLATVKGLAFAAQKPIVGIPSLDILARNALSKNAAEQIYALCDARRNMVFACLYERRGQNLKRVSEYELTSIDAFLKNIKEGSYLLGDAIPLYKDVILKKVKVCFAPAALWFPQARELAHLALPRFEKKKFANIDKLVPLYLYPETCQITLKKTTPGVTNSRGC